MRNLCLYFMAITIYGSAHAAGGPELTRRGMLFGMGATAISLQIPALIPKADAFALNSQHVLPIARSAPLVQSQFIVLDEFQNASAGDLEFMRKILGVKTTDVSNVYSVQALDFGGRGRVMQMAVSDGMHFSEGVARTVQTQTFSAVKKLVENKPEQPLASIENLIDKLEPQAPIPCETRVESPQPVLLIEERVESRQEAKPLQP